jgi:hypothetical protein
MVRQPISLLRSGRARGASRRSLQCASYVRHRAATSRRTDAPSVRPPAHERTRRGGFLSTRAPPWCAGGVRVAGHRCSGSAPQASRAPGELASIRPGSPTRCPGSRRGAAPTQRASGGLQFPARSPTPKPPAASGEGVAPCRRPAHRAEATNDNAPPVRPKVGRRIRTIAKISSLRHAPRAAAAPACAGAAARSCPGARRGAPRRRSARAPAGTPRSGTPRADPARWSA